MKGEQGGGGERKNAMNHCNLTVWNSGGHVMYYLLRLPGLLWENDFRNKANNMVETNKQKLSKICQEYM